MSSIVQAPQHQLPDPICSAAIDLAREAAGSDAGAQTVGELLTTAADGPRTVIHSFSSNLAGYQGWQWQVTLTRGPRSRRVTINDVSLIPGDHALRAPEWLPWTDRNAVTERTAPCRR